MTSNKKQFDKTNKPDTEPKPKRTSAHLTVQHPGSHLPAQQSAGNLAIQRTRKDSTVLGTLTNEALLAEINETKQWLSVHSMIEAEYGLCSDYLQLLEAERARRLGLGQL